MDLLPLAMIQSTNAMNRTMFSALPNAPVVHPEQARVRAFRIRSATARLLVRAASAVAPKPACHLAH